MPQRSTSNYLAGYPAHLVAQVEHLIEQEKLADWLLSKYPHAHSIRNDRALYDYVHEIKNAHLRNAGTVSRVAFDGKLQLIQKALGTHTLVSRVQGGKLKAKQEISVATLFREMPPEFLRMIVVHELAHIKERDHGKAFYQLCQHIEPDYAQLEFELRAYLTYLEAGGMSLWAAPA